jgi:hypothetical protein
MIIQDHDELVKSAVAPDGRSITRMPIWLAIQSLSECNTILIAVSELFVKADHPSILAPNEKVELPDPSRTQPVFHGSHQYATGAHALKLRVHADVIGRSPVSVMPDKCRASDRATRFQYNHCGGWPSMGEVEILGGIIPGARKATALPKFDYSELVALIGLSRLHRLLPTVMRKLAGANCLKREHRFEAKSASTASGCA